MAYTVAAGLHIYTFIFFSFFSPFWPGSHISFISSEWTGCPLHGGIGKLVTGLRHPGLNKLQEHRQEKRREKKKSGQKKEKETSHTEIVNTYKDWDFQGGPSFCFHPDTCYIWRGLQCPAADRQKYSLF